MLFCPLRTGVVSLRVVKHIHGDSLSAGLKRERAKMRIFSLMMLVLFATAATALAVPSDLKVVNNKNQACIDQHKRNVKVCLKYHDPIIRGKCMKAAAKKQSRCTGK